MPTVFVSRDRGFAAPGIPPAEPQMGSEEDAFFVTSDGGASWAAQSPPLPSAGHKCPAGASGFFTSVVSCSFGAPTFIGPDRGVLPAAVTWGSRAAVAFDVTSDGGRSWSLASQRSLSVDPGACKTGCAHWPLVSVASGSAWWVLGWTEYGAPSPSQRQRRCHLGPGCSPDINGCASRAQRAGRHACAGHNEKLQRISRLAAGDGRRRSELAPLGPAVKTMQVAPRRIDDLNGRAHLRV